MSPEFSASTYKNLGDYDASSSDDDWIEKKLVLIVT